MKNIGIKIILFFLILNLSITFAGKGEAVSDVGIVSSLYISVISPDSNVAWKSGSIHDIKWQAPSKYFDNVKIEYTTDYGYSWITIADSVTSVDTVFSWFVPFTPSYYCVVSIYETPFIYGQYGASGFSPGIFTIWSPLADTGSTIQITAPNGGEVWNAGTTQQIKWELNSANIDSLKIEYSTDSGDSWEIISNAFASTDSLYEWVVPNKPSEFSLVRLSDAADSSNRDICNNLFTIDSLVTEVADNLVSNPKEYQILNAYPNPFNPSTTIQYYLPEGANVKLYIYDGLGRIVRKLVDENKPRGSYKVNWNGENSYGATLS